MLTPRSSSANRSRHRLTPPPSPPTRQSQPQPSPRQATALPPPDLRHTLDSACGPQGPRRPLVPRTPPVLPPSSETEKYNRTHPPNCGREGRHQTRLTRNLRAATAARLPACVHRHPNHWHGQTGVARCRRSGCTAPAVSRPTLTHSSLSPSATPLTTAAQRCSAPHCAAAAPFTPLIHKPGPPRQSLPAQQTAGPPPSACERP